MHRRLIGSILLALALAGGHHVTVAARPLYVVCALPNATELFIVVDSFGGVGGAAQQCVHFWKGLPLGVMGQSQETLQQESEGDSLAEESPSSP